VLRVPAGAVEGVLDRLLPLIPGGVREIERGAEVELRMRGAGLPPLREVARAAGVRRRWITEHEVSDDWRRRRLHDYEPLVIGERLVVRPEWAPAASASAGLSPDLIEIVLEESVAFGGGTHPTTRACLELLLELTPQGAFADLGCGTGVLAILAAKLGWAPVSTFDLRPGSVAAAASNAERNRVEVAVAVADLSTDPMPDCYAFAANVPRSVHAAIASGLAPSAPRIGLLSGFGPSETPSVLASYAAHRFRARRVIERDGWTIVLVERE
jgi:ribosomal protein L11 methyltransferase